MGIKIKIPCKEANHICDKTQYKNASLWEKITLNIHLMYCKACRNYTKNNTKLTNALKKANMKFLDKKQKENMKLALDKAVKETPIN